MSISYVISDYYSIIFGYLKVYEFLIYKYHVFITGLIYNILNIICCLSGIKEVVWSL